MKIATPLSHLRLCSATPDAARFQVSDGSGRVYAKGVLDSGAAPFVVRGVLGRHQIVFLSSSGVEVDRTMFLARAATEISSGSSRWERLFNRLEAATAAHAQDGHVGCGYVADRIVRYCVWWLRDDTYAKHAYKYWAADVQSLPQLFLDHQREDGMLHDHFHPSDSGYGHAERAWGPEWVAATADGRHAFDRIPAEADVEFLAVDSVYQGWQASGDDAWMTACLPHLVKCLEYLTTNPLRWDAQAGLVKRGYTIDTWDFQRRGTMNHLGWHDVMYLDETTPMTIMHGDNSGLCQACRQLAVMLRHAGREAEAQSWAEKADAVQAALTRAAWNGRFLRHWADVEDNRLSLSNPYAINRGAVTHEQAVAILREYQRRRTDAPDDLPWEWFSIDPPFPPGSGFPAPGEYVNGGKLTIVAGELARAAFAHGCEDYAVDILQRLDRLLERDGFLAKGYRPPAATQARPPMRMLPLAEHRTAGFTHVLRDGENDLRAVPTGEQEFLGIPFTIPVDGGIFLKGANNQELPECVDVAIGECRARRLFFLHGAWHPVRNEVVAHYHVHYADGASVPIHVIGGVQVGDFWGAETVPAARLAWTGPNALVPRTSLYAMTWDNPRPEVPIVSLSFASCNCGLPFVLAVTASPEAAGFAPGPFIDGLPEQWGSAALVAALVEGLAGVTDEASLFRKARVAPRWLAVGETEAAVTIKYGASDGYVAYRFRHQPDAGRIHLDVTGSGEQFDFHILLPQGCQPTRVEQAGRPIPFEAEWIEESAYANFACQSVDAGAIAVYYQDRWSVGPKWTRRHVMRQPKVAMTCWKRPGRCIELGRVDAPEHERRFRRCTDSIELGAPTRCATFD